MIRRSKAGWIAYRVGPRRDQTAQSRFVDLSSRYIDDAMATAKQDAMKILDGLPEEASLEDIQYHLYVLQRIQRGREDVAAGRVVSQDEVDQRLSRWLEK